MAIYRQPSSGTRSTGDSVLQCAARIGQSSGTMLGPYEIQSPMGRPGIGLVIMQVSSISVAGFWPSSLFYASSSNKRAANFWSWYSKAGQKR